MVPTLTIFGSVGVQFQTAALSATVYQSNMQVATEVTLTGGIFFTSGGDDSSSGSGNTVTVDYATSDASAIAGTDYTETSGTLTFSGGATTQEIDIPIIGPIGDTNNTFYITLSNATGADVGTPSVQTVTFSVIPVVSLTNPGPLSNYVGDSPTPNLNATDAAGNALTVTDNGTLPPGLSVGNGGAISGTIAVGADVTGPYTVAITATDATLDLSASQTFTWNVADLTVAANQNLNAFENSPLQIQQSTLLANSYDADGYTLSIASTGTPTNGGALTANSDGSYTYTPVANTVGTDTFTYTLNNGNGGSATGTVTITVSNPVSLDYPGNLINYVGDSATPNLNATDAAGNALTVTDNGTLPPELTVDNGGVITGTPTTSGTYSVTISATDATLGVSVSQSFTWAIFTPPTATSPTLTVNQNGSLIIQPSDLATDADGNTLAISNVSDPTNGFLYANTDGSYTYKPIAGFIGTDSFTYTISDGHSGTAYGTATITVQPLVYFDSPSPYDIQGDTATITVDISSVWSKDVTVNYATSDGTAVAGMDYDVTSGMVTIPAGQTSAAFTLPILTNPNATNGEKFSIALSNPTNDGLGTPSKTEFAILVALPAAADPLVALNRISGQMDNRQGRLDRLLAQIRTALNNMAAATSDDAYNAILTLTLIPKIDEVVDVSSQIDRLAILALQDCQGEAFRIAGIWSGLVNRNIDLGLIQGLLNGAVSTVPVGPNSTAFAQSLQQQSGRVGASAAQNMNFLPTNINQQVAGDNADAIASLNTTYTAMQVLLATATANDTYLIQGLFTRMTQDAEEGTAGSLDDYNLAQATLQVAINVNIALGTGLWVGGYDVSALGLAYGTNNSGGAMAATTEDSFAQKGVNWSLNNFSNLAGTGLLDVERGMAVEQQNILGALVAQNLVGGQSATVLNSSSIVDALDEAQGAFIGL